MRLKRSEGKLKHKPATALQRRGLIFILAFAVVGGAILLLATHAATPFASLNADRGNLGGGALAIADNNASDGKAVKFGQGGGSTTTVTAPNSWVNVTGNLSNMDSECGNLTMLSAVPNSSDVLAGVATDNTGKTNNPPAEGLWKSTNGSNTWVRLGTGSGSAVITNRPNDIVYDPTNPANFWVAGIYGTSFGVFSTTDGGTHFTAIPNTFHDNTVGVDFSDATHKTLLVGKHEQVQQALKTTDASTWTNIGANLPGGTGFSESVLILNAQTYLVNTDTSWSGGTPGIYRSTNAGASWTKVSSANTNASPPLVASNGTIFWPLYDGNVARSTDSGQTFTTVGSGLTGVPIIELPNEGVTPRRLVAIGNNNTLVVSADNGTSWSPFGAALPRPLDGTQVADVVYSTGTKAFFISHWDCPDGSQPQPVQTDAIFKSQ